MHDHVGRPALAILLGSLAIAAAGCADTLPDQDLRITVAVPVAKLPAEDLWKEYQADSEAADAAYWGKAIEVSGTVTHLDAEPAERYILLGQSDQFGVRANLLDDTADEILAATKEGDRLRLKCFCAGLDGHVILKSCVRPD
jgi:hypothetical protein